MKYYLCLLIVVSVAAGTPRQSYFGHFQNAYQDGQANHAGGQLFGDYRVQGNLGPGNEFYGHQGPIGGQPNFNHLGGVPFGDGVNNAGLKRQEPQSYQPFFNYDYQI